VYLLLTYLLTYLLKFSYLLSKVMKESLTGESPHHGCI